MDLSKRKSLFRKKSIENNQHENGLARVIGMPSLIFFGVGGIVGTGLFTVTGIAASEHAGPAVLLSFLIGALACSFIGLCYSELAGMITESGSSYSYIYIAMGEFIAWIVGWNLVLEYSVGAAAVAVSWSQYLKSILISFHLHLPYQFFASPLEKININGQNISGILNLPSTFVIIFLSLYLIQGIKQSFRMNNMIVLIKLFVVFAVIAFGFSYVDFDNFKPFIPENTGQFGHFGISGIFQAAGMIFFAYIGFDSVASTAQEVKNPARDIPKAILIIITITALIYVTFAFVIVGLVNFHQLLGNGAPVATAIDHTPYKWLQPVIKFSIIIGYFPVLVLLLVGQTRIFFTLSKDGLIPKFFSVIHPDHKTPHLSHMFFMVFICILSAFIPISILSEMCSIGALSAFFFVCISVMILRRTHKDFPRRFKMPGGDIIPIFGTLVCCVLMYSLSNITWLTIGGWMLIGIIIYWLYGHKHSKLQQKFHN